MTGSAALFLLELTTGIRRGQVCGLKWTSVDLDAGEITVHDNRVVVGGHARYKAGGKTKNADQTTALDKETVAALRTWRDTQDRERDVFGSDYHPGNYVFTVRGWPPTTPGLHPAAIRPARGSRTRGSRGSRPTICGTPTPRVRSKPEYTPKVVSDRIGHANVGFFLQSLRASFTETMTETPPSRPPHSFSGRGGVAGELAGICG